MNNSASRHAAAIELERLARGLRCTEDVLAKVVSRLEKVDAILSGEAQSVGVQKAVSIAEGVRD